MNGQRAGRERCDLEKLKEARQVIAHRENWTQFAEHRTFLTGGFYDEAYCSAGAIFHVAESRSQAWRLVDMFSFDRPIDIMTYNDTHSHKRVLKLWDRVIEKHQREQDRVAVRNRSYDQMWKAAQDEKALKALDFHPDPVPSERELVNA